jgi:hypothetical protein
MPRSGGAREFASLDSTSGRFLDSTESEDLFGGRSTQYSGTWPVSGSMRSGAVYEQPMPALPTVASASSLLPTPNTMEMLPVREGEALERSLHRGDLNGSRRSQTANLRERVVAELVNEKVLPTPTAMDSKQSGGAEGSSNLTLTDVLQRGRTLPTPSVSNAQGNQRNNRGELLLPGVAESLLPTPRATDDQGGTHPLGRPKNQDNLATRLTRMRGPEESAPLLGTPTARDWKDGQFQPNVPTNGLLGRMVWDLSPSDELMPTPKAGDADFGLPRTSGRPPEMSTHLATRLEFTIGARSAERPANDPSSTGDRIEPLFSAGSELSDD